MPTSELILIGVVILALVNLYAFAYTIIIAMLVAIAKLEIQEISLGFGKTLAQFKMLGRNWRIGALPLGSSVKFVDGAKGLESLSTPMRLLFRVSGEIIILAAALAVLPVNPIELLHQVTSTIAGLFHVPLESAHTIATEIASAIRSESVISLIALAFAIQGIVNLLPLPPLNGGIFCIDLLKWMTGRSLQWLTEGPVLLVSLLVILYAYGWAIAGFFLI